jgi:hypothetical protein
MISTTVHTPWQKKKSLQTCVPNRSLDAGLLVVDCYGCEVDAYSGSRIIHELVASHAEEHCLQVSCSSGELLFHLTVGLANPGVAHHDDLRPTI